MHSRSCLQRQRGCASFPRLLLIPISLATSPSYLASLPSKSKLLVPLSQYWSSQIRTCLPSQQYNLYVLYNSGTESKWSPLILLPVMSLQDLEHTKSHISCITLQQGLSNHRACCGAWNSFRVLRRVCGSYPIPMSTSIFSSMQDQELKDIQRAWQYKQSSGSIPKTYPNLFTNYHFIDVRNPM